MENLSEQIYQYILDFRNKFEISQKILENDFNSHKNHLNLSLGILENDTNRNIADVKNNIKSAVENANLISEERMKIENYANEAIDSLKAIVKEYIRKINEKIKEPPKGGFAWLRNNNYGRA